MSETKREESPSTQTVLAWLGNLRTQTGPDGRFHYKPLLLLALLDLLDAANEHPNSFGYEELFGKFEELAAERGPP